MWTVALYDLRLSDQQFWRLTLRQYNALVKRLNEDTEAKKYNHATLLAAIHNQAATEKKDLIRPEDFLGKQHKPTPQELDKKMYNAFYLIKKMQDA